MEISEKNLLMLCAVEHAKFGKYTDALQVIGQILDEEPDDFQALFNKAFTLQLSGNTAEAEEVFYTLIDLVPESPGIHFQMGKLLSGKGELEQALSHFIRESEIQPFSADPWYELGMLLSTMGRSNEAKDAFHKGSVFVPDDYQILIQLGVCHLQDNDLQESVRCFDHALEIHPGDEQALYNKARIYEILGKREDEVACYDEIIRWHPETLFAWLKKGLVLMVAEEYDRSLSCFSVACRLENTGYMPFLLKGMVYVIIDQAEDAIIWFNEAYTRSPGNTDISLHLGRAFGSAERHEEALVAFDRVLEIKSCHPEAAEGKIRALYHLRKWDEVLCACHQFREANPKNPTSYLLEARVLGWHMGDADKALEVILNGLSLIPSDEHLICLQADILVLKEQDDSAISLLTSEMGGHTGSIPVMYRLATLLAKQGNFETAAGYYDQIVEISPEDAQTLYLSGETYEMCGDPEAALKRYTAAVTHDPTSPGGWTGRARTLLELGSPHDSRRSAIRAVHLSGDSEEAWFWKGRAEIQAGLPEDARKTFTYFTLTWPENHDGWRCLGDVMLILNEGNAACMAYTRALDLKTSDHEARYGKIKALLSIGEITTALGEYDISLGLKGDNFRDLYGKGMILIELGRRDDARTCLESTMDCSDKDAEALCSLAHAWSALQEYSLSEQYYQQSLESDPDNSNTWRMRGHTRYNAGNHAGAVECFDRALVLDPDDNLAYEGRKTSLELLQKGEHFPSDDT